MKNVRSRLRQVVFSVCVREEIGMKRDLTGPEKILRHTPGLEHLQQTHTSFLYAPSPWQPSAELMSKVLLTLSERGVKRRLRCLTYVYVCAFGGMVCGFEKEDGLVDCILRRD